jgi:hypothetical protein
MHLHRSQCRLQSGPFVCTNLACRDLPRTSSTTLPADLSGADNYLLHDLGFVSQLDSQDEASSSQAFTRTRPTTYAFTDPNTSKRTVAPSPLQPLACRNAIVRFLTGTLTRTQGPSRPAVFRPGIAQRRDWKGADLLLPVECFPSQQTPSGLSASARSRVQVLAGMTPELCVRGNIQRRYCASQSHLRL